MLGIKELAELVEAVQEWRRALTAYMAIGPADLDGRAGLVKLAEGLHAYCAAEHRLLVAAAVIEPLSNAELDLCLKLQEDERNALDNLERFREETAK